MLAYLHPITGALVVFLLAYAGTAGLRARNDRRRRDELLDSHTRYAPWAFWLTLATWIGGLTTTWLWRSDLELAASNHFRIGTALLLPLAGGWWTARRMEIGWARDLHPWLGIAVLLLAAAQVFFGLQITP